MHWYTSNETDGMWEFVRFSHLQCQGLHAFWHGIVGIILI